MSAVEWLAHPLAAVLLTVALYALAQALQRRWMKANVLLITSGSLLAVLLLLNIPYEVYREGGQYIAYLLGPATVALGVPLYKHSLRIKRHFAAIAAGVTAGSLCGIVSSAICVWLTGGSQQIMLAMLSKSVTTPISIEIAKSLGGQPELAALFAVSAGIFGSLLGPELLRRFGVPQHIPLGTGVGTASHGIGTARLIRESELEGGVSGLAMGLAGIVTSLLMVPLYYWLGS